MVNVRGYIYDKESNRFYSPDYDKINKKWKNPNKPTSEAKMRQIRKQFPNAKDPNDDKWRIKWYYIDPKNKTSIILNGMDEN
jgi:hypothetical protein